MHLNPGVTGKILKMKRLCLVGAAMIVAGSSQGQGFVNFGNGILPESLICTNTGSSRGPISGPTGTWRFELFWARDGVTDSLQFSSTGLTNVNSALRGPGRIFSIFTAVPGLTASSFVQLQVRGWSANLGDTWSEAASRGHIGQDGEIGWLGESAIVRYQLTSAIFPGASLFYNGGIAMPQGASQIANFDLFSSSSPSSLSAVPEPSTLALGLLGMGLGLVFLRRRR
jgi:hypothetical protein